MEWLGCWPQSCSTCPPVRCTCVKTVSKKTGNRGRIHLGKNTGYLWVQQYKISKEILPDHDFYPIKINILIFYFGCCCSSSFFLSSFSIACILVCVLLDSNALVGSPCCSIVLCGNPCIDGICVCWVVVCCTMNNKREMVKKKLR